MGLLDGIDDQTKPRIIMPVPMPRAIVPPVALAAPSIPSGPLMTGMPQLSAPVAPVAVHDSSLDTTTQKAQAEVSRLQSTGSGIDQIKNPLLRGIARGADIAGAIAGSVFAPLRTAEALIPGTSEHHDYMVRRANARLAASQAQDYDTAKTSDEQAQTVQRQALAEQESAKAAALADPHKAIDVSKTVQTDDGVYQLNPDTGRYDQRVGDRVVKQKSPEEQAFEASLAAHGGDAVKAFAEINGAKNQKDASLQQQFLDGYRKAHPEASDTDAIAATIRATQTQPKIDVHTAEAPAGGGGTFQLAFQGNKPVMFNTKTGEIKDAPVTRQAQGAGGAPMTTADKNRASLAKIASNNLDQIQGIVQRRPDLLGKMGAIKTTADLFGSNDPDLVALGNEVHNFAMANAGIHGSRSVQNVQNAEQDLLGHFKNGARGIQGGIDANRANLSAIINPNAQVNNGPPPGAKVRDYTQVGK